MSDFTTAIDDVKSLLNKAALTLPEDAYLDFLSEVSEECDARFTAIDEGEPLDLQQIIERARLRDPLADNAADAAV